MNNNIYKLFEQRYPSPESVFIETLGGQRYSYANLAQEVARLANFLSTQGLQKGDRIAVQVEKSPQVIFLYLACLRAGFIYLPLNTAYTENELSYFLENAEPALVVCSPESDNLFNQITATHTKVFTLDAQGSGTIISESRNANTEFNTVECDKDGVAVILYTSGTTGQPKGAMITHGNLSSNALALQETWGWQQNDVLIHALPVFHIHGLFVAVHTVLLGGSKMLFLPRFDAKTIIDLLPQATVLMGVPTFYTRLLEEAALNQDSCHNMRLFISGSAPLLEQTFMTFRERTGHSILERYGMTETGMNTSNPLQGKRLAGTVGLPLPGVETRIINDDGHVASDDQVGQLQVRGPNVFKGYWQMPDKTGAEFTDDGFFKTGDLARHDAQGYISIVGRDKDMVITGGYNVYPREIELILNELPGIRESAIIGLPHKDFGEAVTAVVIQQQAQQPLAEKEIMAALKNKLAGYKIPKRILILDKLPRNTMGKIQKKQLREEFASLYS